MSEQLELLLELQRIDGELAAIESRRESLPRKIEELVAEKEGISAEVAERDDALEERKKERRKCERDLEDLTARMNELKSKQLVIKTNEEYAALSTEIDFVKREISQSEDRVLALLEETEAGAVEAEGARTEAEDSQRAIDSRIGELEGSLAELDEELAVKKDERLRISMRVDAALLRRYEGIMRSKGDLALVGIVDGACSGCYKSLPPQTLIEVRRAASFIECDGCGRILYWQPESDVG